VKSLWPVIFFFSAAAMAVGGAVGYLVGGLRGEGDAHRRQCEEQREALRAVLASDPAFARLEVSPSCDAGWVTLLGRVGRGEAWVRLRQAVIRALGEKRAEFALELVTVEVE
jgi:hypothetical protein